MADSDVRIEALHGADRIRARVAEPVASSELGTTSITVSESLSGARPPASSRRSMLCSLHRPLADEAAASPGTSFPNPGAARRRYHAAVAAHSTPCDICERIRQLRDGTHPNLIAELETGWAVLGDSQAWPGYSLLLCKEPVTELHELARDVRARHLEEVAQLAEAVHRAVLPHKLNYELLGNSVPHVHWHLFPRRADEPDPKNPVWAQVAARNASVPAMDPGRRDEIRRSIAGELASIRSR